MAIPIKQLLPLAVKRIDRQKRLETLAICALYQELVKRFLNLKAAKNSRAFNVKNRILWVETSSSAWSCEISFYANKIIREINQCLKKKAIKRICFQARG